MVTPCGTSEDHGDPVDSNFFLAMLEEKKLDSKTFPFCGLAWLVNQPHKSLIHR